VVLTDAAAGDPVIGAAFPERFSAFEWHYYTWELPSGATLLADNVAARQAYRLGERAWAVQFHPEVNRAMLDNWFEWGRAELPRPPAEMHDETDARLPTWNAQGRALCTAFLDEATRLPPG
jgi:GMP synthase (glutamine-hydrolysing)